MLSQNILEEAMLGAGMTGAGLYMEECGSTNIAAKEIAAKGAADLSCVVADAQTGGKGRAGRTWASPAGMGLYVSVIMRGITMETAPMIPLMAAVAVCKAVKAACGEEIEPGIKWPNDIVIGSRKICGILVEGSSGVAICGMGINVAHRQSDFPEELLCRAASLRMCGSSITRAHMLSALLKSFREEYSRLSAGEYDNLLEQYRVFCVNIGKDVMVHAPGESYGAKAIDIAEDGALIVVPFGEDEQKKIYAGDVSVRGLMGYV